MGITVLSYFASAINGLDGSINSKEKEETVSTFELEKKTQDEYHYLKFHGQLGDYFKIWIVNTFLTLITFGIYSPWAKIRKMKYLNQVTEFRGSRMDYHAEPLSIHLGRLIAIFLFGLYLLGGKFNPVLGVIGLCLVFFAMRLLFVKSMRFKAKNTSYRNIRFGFRGTVREAYKIWFRYLTFFFVTGLFAVINAWFLNQWISSVETVKSPIDVWTHPNFLIQLGIGIVNLTYIIKMAPKILNALYHFVYDNILFGGTAVSIECDSKSVFSSILVKLYRFFGVAMLLFAAYVAVIVGSMYMGISKLVVLGFIIPSALAMYLVFLYLSFLTPYLIINFIWGNLKAGPYRSKINLSRAQFMKVAFGNLFAILFSFGLLIPWAQLRYRKLITEAKAFNIDDLDQFTAEASESASALGAEVMDVFDFDFEVGF